MAVNCFQPVIMTDDYNITISSIRFCHADNSIEGCNDGIISTCFQINTGMMSSAAGIGRYDFCSGEWKSIIFICHESQVDNKRVFVSQKFWIRNSYIGFFPWRKILSNIFTCIFCFSQFRCRRKEYIYLGKRDFC